MAAAAAVSSSLSLTSSLARTSARSIASCRLSVSQTEAVLRGDHEHDHAAAPPTLLRFTRVLSCNQRAGRRQHRLSVAVHASAKSSDVDAASNGLPELAEVLTMLKERKQQSGQPGQEGPGEVYLVGTGPGDPELLTVKALRLMQTADLVLYDRLVSNDIMSLVSENSRLIYVGKSAGFHTRTQDQIHELLLAFAQAGARVLRLKGGDPLVFGRGGEEMEYLEQHGIKVRIVPGITAAAGIGAELGIPLTHRGLASSVTFLTGHTREAPNEDPFEGIAGADLSTKTLVVYMGLATLPDLVTRLQELGLTGSTPAVAVFSTIEELPHRVKQAGLKSPTLIVVGEVVALAADWPSHASFQGNALTRQDSKLADAVAVAVDSHNVREWLQPLAVRSQLESISPHDASCYI
eukprot:jgi/Chlat1/8033/Chrsp71S07508